MYRLSVNSRPPERPATWVTPAESLPTRPPPAAYPACWPPCCDESQPTGSSPGRWRQCGVPLWPWPRRSACRADPPPSQSERSVCAENRPSRPAAAQRAFRRRRTPCADESHSCRDGPDAREQVVGNVQDAARCRVPEEGHAIQAGHRGLGRSARQGVGSLRDLAARTMRE